MLIPFLIGFMFIMLAQLPFYLPLSNLYIITIQIIRQVYLLHFQLEEIILNRINYEYDNDDCQKYLNSRYRHYRFIVYLNALKE